MAIALDTSATHSGTASFSYTVTGSNTILIAAFHWAVGTTSSASAVTYNGVALTSLGAAGSGTNSDQVSLWYLKNPTTGANTFAFTNTGSSTVTQSLISYTGVAQVTPVDGAAVTAESLSFSSTTPLTLTITTSNANEFLVSALTGSGSFTATDLNVSAPATVWQRNASGTGVGGIADNSVATAGSNSIQWVKGTTSARSVGAIVVALKPAGTPFIAAPPKIVNQTINRGAYF